jgi:DNA-binding transcriptional MerR regulator
MSRSALELPAKLFFRIGEVAGLVGVEPHVLRYWEREFRSIRPTKSAKGQRVYSRKDVENLLRVRDLLYRDGFTIAGAKKKLHEPTQEAVPSERSVDSRAPTAAPSSAVVFPVAAAAMIAPSASIPALRPAVRSVGVRDTLVALRNEVEGFLAELAASSAGSGPGQGRS